MLEKKMLADYPRGGESADKSRADNRRRLYSTPVLSRFGQVHELVRGTGTGGADVLGSKNE